jgi:hypothetical protein
MLAYAGDGLVNVVAVVVKVTVGLVGVEGIPTQ